MKRRNGYTLIECLVAMALATSALTVVAMTMSGIQQAQRRVQEQASSERELSRFATRWRTDAHEAWSAECENAESDTVEMVLSDQESVRYTLLAGYVKRVQRRNDEVVHQETYRLPDTCTARWELDRKGPTPVVTLKLEPLSLEESGRIDGHAQQVHAAVGLLAQKPAQAKS